MLQLETLGQIRETALNTCKRRSTFQENAFKNYYEELGYELCQAIDYIIMYAEVKSQLLNELYDLKAPIVEGYPCIEKQVTHLSRLYKMMVKQYKIDIRLAEIDQQTNDLIESIKKVLA